jgi:vacuolar protein sorting-associated protein 45
MNVVSAVKMYVTRMAEESGPGMKVLLMDKQTVSICIQRFSTSGVLYTFTALN